ncbi:hypothetical protein REPUB_Repub01dG0240400 [Reevesia pubescens]
MMNQQPSLTSALPSRVPIFCGRGDKKTKRGKTFKGSYVNARLKKDKKIEHIKDKVEIPSRGDRCLILDRFWFN